MISFKIDTLCKNSNLFFKYEQAEQCIFIGDNENADIRGANAVGMKSIFFNPDAKIVSADADANLNDYANLWEIIQKIQSKGFISKIDIKPKC